MTTFSFFEVNVEFAKGSFSSSILLRIFLANAALLIDEICLLLLGFTFVKSSSVTIDDCSLS
jgi:hypothetical protein